MLKGAPKIGNLDKRIEIQSRVLSADTFGEPVPAWETIAVVYAAVEPISGREAWQAQQAQADVTHRVTIRFRAELAPKMRFRFRGRALNIDSVVNLEEDDRFSVCLCKEEV